MDLLKTPSVQSLVDSDAISIESLQSLDIEELDEVEYALPTITAAPSLAELLSEDEPTPASREPGDCFALQAELLQGVSQQLHSAQERSAAGAATALTVGCAGRLAAGTGHGHVLAFQEQALRWACDINADRGAVSCLAYNSDATRLLAGYARGLICQYESSRGIVLRRVTPGGGVWGALRVTWADTAALALDTGGSVWLMKFSRPLGVRSAQTSCLFSGARGEVVAMSARDARVLALATLSRVIAVAGGRAAGVRLAGPAHTLPVLAWCEYEESVLVCARGTTLQWLAVNAGSTTVSLKLLRRAELTTAVLWIGWLGGRLAILDVKERLRLWEDDDDRAMDLSPFEPVYASAFFKGVWTDGRVSQALAAAGAGALGGVCAADGALALLGRGGVVRVRPRDILTRAKSLAAAGRTARALRLLCSARSAEARELAATFVNDLSERPQALVDAEVAAAVIKLCLRNGLREELWGRLWESGMYSDAFVESLGIAVAENALSAMPPPPDASQDLLERLADVAPEVVERFVAVLPLTSIDPHRASVFARDRGLWRTVGVIAAALGGTSAAMRELAPRTAYCRAGGQVKECVCAGEALLLAAGEGLAGRGPGGTQLPEHARPAARHEALRVLLGAECGTEEVSSGEWNGARGVPPAPLLALLRHDAHTTVRLLQQCARDPPFAGPLGKQNRLRVARALLSWAPQLEWEDRVEVLEFISGQVVSGALPTDREALQSAHALAATLNHERADRAWCLLFAARPAVAPTAQLDAAAARPRVLWHLLTLLARHQEALDAFFLIDPLTKTDVDQLFEYLSKRLAEDADVSLLKRHLKGIVDARPSAAATIISIHCPDLIDTALASGSEEAAESFANQLLESGSLTGDAAAIHLRNLCTRRPNCVVEFLQSHAGIVRPEDALRIVREIGPRLAEPTCLEASGDPEAALDVILALVAESQEQEKREELMMRACELCSRAAPSMPAATATRMWGRLMDSDAASVLPASVLLEAVAHVPLETLLARTCATPRFVMMLASCAASREAMWQCASRVLDRELHASLARELRVAGRARSVCNTRCAVCRRGFGIGAVRSCECGQATHVDCGSESRCSVCSRRGAVDVRLGVLPQKPKCPEIAHALRLVAPYRPDLEGTA